MTKREARKLVLGCAATLLRSHISNGSEWIHMDGDDFRSDDDIGRIEDEVRRLVQRLVGQRQRRRSAWRAHPLDAAPEAPKEKP